jgi:hypothetical protein
VDPTFALLENAAYREALAAVEQKAPPTPFADRLERRLEAAAALREALGYPDSWLEFDRIVIGWGDWRSV